MAGYGVFRFLVEFVRDSESMIAGWFSMGQLLSLPMWGIAGFLFWYALTHAPAITPRVPAPAPAGTGLELSATSTHDRCGSRDDSAR